MEMIEERIQVIKEYKTPHNLRTLRRFIGIINYYKRLIQDLISENYHYLELQDRM